MGKHELCIVRANTKNKTLPTAVIFIIASVYSIFLYST